MVLKLGQGPPPCCPLCVSTTSKMAQEGTSSGHITDIRKHLTPQQHELNTKDGAEEIKQQPKMSV